MNILVTGATGKVGSRLVPHLLQAGHTVRILVREEQAPAVLELKILGAHVYKGDILDPHSLRAPLAGCDAVVHMAALFRAVDDAKAINRVNIEGTENLAKAALQASPAVRFIFASTNLVYSSKSGPAKEDDTLAPEQPYPVSKLQAEKVLLELCASDGLDVRILRFAFVYGAGDPHLHEGVKLFETWHMHPAQRLHLVHHADIAQAIDAQLRTPNLAGRVYNVADDAPITVQEILDIIRESATLPDPTQPLTQPWRGLVDTHQIRHDLGFRPLIPSLYAARDLGVL